MATSTLEVIIRGRDLLTPTVRQAQASLSGLGKTADGLKGSILTGLGLGAGVAGFQLVTSAVGKTVDVLADATRAAIEDEASIRKLTTTLQENVPAWNGSLSSIEAFTKAGQQLAFTDDAIREAVGKLAVSTGSVREAMDLTRLSMDLARLKGIDLATATDYINKALGGQIGALRRVLPFIDANASSTEALAAIQKAATGQAESYAQTTEGRLVKAQIALDEALEKLGKVTMPTVGLAAEGLADTVEYLARSLDLLTGASDDAADSQNGLAAIIEGILGALGPLIEANNALSAEYERRKEAQDAVVEATGDEQAATLLATTAAGAYAGALHGVAVEGEGAASSVRDLAAEQRAQAAAAVIAEWNAQAVGDAYWQLAIRADLAAERTDALRKTQEGGAYSALIASTGAWTQATAYEALNKGLERAGLGATATDERMKSLTKAEGGKGAAAKGLTTALGGETDAMDAATEAAKKLEDATKPKGKPDILGINGTGRPIRQRRGKTDAERTGAGAAAPTNALYGTFDIGSGASLMLPTAALPATTPAILPLTTTAPAGTTTTTTLPNETLTIHTQLLLDGKVISDVVDEYLARKARL